MRTGRIYGLLDSTGRFRYVGSTYQALQERFRGHRHSARADPLSCPLYRECDGNLDDWTAVQLAEIAYDELLMPNALKEAEQVAIAALRARGEELLNHNAAIDTNAARRAYMAEWRRQNAGYMAAKGREHRERRRQKLLQRTAESGLPWRAALVPARCRAPSACGRLL